MPFTAEITFSGLCLAVIDGGADPKQAKRARVAMVRAAHHSPRLASRLMDQKRIDEDVVQNVFLDMSGTRYGVLDLEGSVGLLDRRRRNDGRLGPPRLLGPDRVDAIEDDEDVGFLMDLGEHGVERLRLRDSDLAAYVELENRGVVTSRDLFFRRDGSAARRDQADRHPVLADDFVYRFEVVAPRLRIVSGGRWLLSLRPADDILRLSISYEPTTLHGMPKVAGHGHSILRHIEMLGKFVTEGELKLPDDASADFRTPDSPKCNTPKIPGDLVDWP